MFIPKTTPPRWREARLLSKEGRAGIRQIPSSQEEEVAKCGESIAFPSSQEEGSREARGWSCFLINGGTYD